MLLHANVIVAVLAAWAAGGRAAADTDNYFLFGAGVECPPRQREDWERSGRAELLAGYRKADSHCHDVEIIMLPLAIHIDNDLAVSTMRVEIYLEWEDPYLPVAASRVVLNASEVWVPQIVSVGLSDRLLSPTSVVGVLETVPATNHVRSYLETTLRGWCSPYAAEDWPRDQAHCAFLVQPATGQYFNLSHDMTMADAIQIHRDVVTRSPFERLASWEVLTLDSKLYTSSAILVEVVLRRLPAQLQAVAVHPLVAVSALGPASVALAPTSAERPALIVVSFLLHAVFLFGLPHFVAGLEGSVIPRALLVYRDFGLLLLLVAVQWLLSLRLASRTRPLPAWAQAVARTLAVLRAPLLLTATPPATPPATLVTSRKPLDEQSVELSGILDRLTFLAVSASYLGLVIIGLR